MNPGRGNLTIEETSPSDEYMKKQKTANIVTSSHVNRTSGFAFFTLKWTFFNLKLDAFKNKMEILQNKTYL